MDMILTGRFITGAEAWEMGMCERVVPEDQTASVAMTGNENETERRGRKEAVLEVALGIAFQICNGAPGVVGPAMRAVRAGNEQAENEEYDGILDTEDRLEALAAFYEKRKPFLAGGEKGMDHFVQEKSDTYIWHKKCLGKHSA